MTRGDERELVPQRKPYDGVTEKKSHCAASSEHDNEFRDQIVINKQFEFSGSQDLTCVSCSVFDERLKGKFAA